MARVTVGGSIIEFAPGDVVTSPNGMLGRITVIYQNTRRALVRYRDGGAALIPLRELRHARSDDVAHAPVRYGC